MKKAKKRITNILNDGIKKIPDILLKKQRDPKEINNIVLNEILNDNKTIPSYVIIKLNNKYANEYKVIGETLSREYGNNKFAKINNANAIIIETDPREINSLIRKFNTKKNGFSNKVRTALNYTNRTYKSNICYTPETFMNYLNVVLGQKKFKGNRRRRLKEIISGSLWHHEAINVYSAWEKTKGKCGYKVAIIDTGCDYKHKEIKNSFGANFGYNYVDDNNDPMDYNGHGTHVAGSIAGENVGVAPESKIVALKVLNDNGVGTIADVMKAVDYCGNKSDIKVLNLSLGSNQGSSIERALFKAVAEKGKLIFAAAGNSGILQYEYPAAYEGVISTAATDERNLKAKFSTMNDQVSNSCPGVNIYSSIPGNNYDIYNGTSMACPQNAGIGILGVSIDSNLEYNEYLSILENTCLELGKGESKQKEMYGFGLAQAEKLVGILEYKKRYRKQR